METITDIEEMRKIIKATGGKEDPNQFKSIIAINGIPIVYNVK